MMKNVLYMFDRWKKGTLVLRKPNIKVLGCMYRNNGLVNNFCFTDEFVKALYKVNVKVGMDYMAFNYKGSKKEGITMQVVEKFRKE